jgi:hypothetical protein
VIATDPPHRQRARQPTLTAADRHNIATMLNFSDEHTSDPMHEPAVSCTVVRAGHRVERTQSVEADRLPSRRWPIALIARGSQMAYLCGNLHRSGPTKHLYPGTGINLQRSWKRLGLSGQRDHDCLRHSVNPTVLVSL